MLASLDGKKNRGNCFVVVGSHWGLFTLDPATSILEALTWMSRKEFVTSARREADQCKDAEIVLRPIALGLTEVF